MSHKHHEDSLLRRSNARFLNRELSWVAFNTRVLELAEDKNIPLMERVNFLGISADNLDEFYMVRVAGLKDYVRQGITTQGIDGLSPAQELQRIHAAAGALIYRQHECWKQLRKEIKDAGITIAKAEKLNEKEHDWLEDYFTENIFPVLTPIALDPAHPFPFLPNLSLSLIFQLRHKEGHGTKEHIAIVPLPGRLARFIRIPGKELQFVLLEDVVQHFFEFLFPGYEKLESCEFRIVRDSDLDLDDDTENFVRNFELAVKARQRGEVIRVKLTSPAPSRLVQLVCEQLKVDTHDIMEVEELLGLASLKELGKYGDATLHYPPFAVRFPERINDYDGDCFAAIAAKDIVIHHPFETFDVVVQFLKQATRDPNVVSIKQTLYRTSDDSPIVKALIEAAEAGKSVTALVELKARFDEEANYKWARDMERAGVQVAFGFVKLKTHAKVALVTRQEGDHLKTYAHFGTGNYHPTTAKIYTDLSFFTCDPDLCRDASYLFNFMTGYAPPKEYKKLIVAPESLRKTLIKLIKKERDFARDGKHGSIWAKMNSLVDAELIDALYDASQDGVQIDLVVRGICCLRPGVPGLSENIRVKSIVGRFLEHSRIFCFGNGHKMPSKDAKVFISSADWMTRNFDWRVEIAVPIENETVHAQILDQIMAANLKDEKQSWRLDAEGNYTRLTPTKNLLSAQEFFIKNPSLSGRGKALKKMKMEAGDEGLQMIKNTK